MIIFVGIKAMSLMGFFDNNNNNNPMYREHKIVDGKVHEKQIRFLFLLIE